MVTDAHIRHLTISLWWHFQRCLHEGCKQQGCLWA